jgi:xanthine dehydrogenase YagT iron-sulfur-binding subunit
MELQRASVKMTQRRTIEIRMVQQLFPLSMFINGESYAFNVDPRTTVLDLLRENIGLTGTKEGCNRGECGACTVHVDGKSINSCMALALSFDGRNLTTIEGLVSKGSVTPLQQAFIDCDAFQCGFCTPGQIMSGMACITAGAATSDSDVREWMSGNICRCSAYPQIVEAIRSVAERSNDASV